MKRPRRVVGLVLLSLGLGVVTTYGVAWGLMNRVDLSALVVPGHRQSGVDGGEWAYFVASGSGVDWVFARNLAKVVGDRLEDRRLEDGQVPPPWSVTGRVDSRRIVDGSGVSLRVQDVVLERCAGWPRRAVVDRQYRAALKSPGWKPVPGWSYSVQWGSMVFPSQNVTLAFMPVCPGFVVDAVVYGAAWWAVLWGVGGLWRWRRRAAGLCEGCGYEVKGLVGGVCPECGSAVKGT